MTLGTRKGVQVKYFIYEDAFLNLSAANSHKPINLSVSYLLNFFSTVLCESNHIVHDLIHIDC